MVVAAATCAVMRSIGRQRRDRRRLGRFVALAEVQADLSPTTIFDKPKPEAHRVVAPPSMEQGAGNRPTNNAVLSVGGADGPHDEDRGTNESAS